MVFVNDPLTSGGHIRLLDIIITTSTLSCGQMKHTTIYIGKGELAIYSSYLYLWIIVFCTLNVENLLNFVFQKQHYKRYLITYF